MLESIGVRPRQARYQAALRPDMKCIIHSKAVPNITPNLEVRKTVERGFVSDFG